MDNYYLVMVWLGIAVAVALIGGVAVNLARRWSRQYAEKQDAITPFTFQDLRDMRATGQISEEEFSAMRSSLLRQVREEDGEEVPESIETPPPADDSPPEKQCED